MSEGAHYHDEKLDTDTFIKLNTLALQYKEASVEKKTELCKEYAKLIKNILTN